MTRRDWLAAAGFTLAGCSSPRATGYPGAALVAVSGERFLAVVDLLQFRLRDPIPLGAAPTAVLPAAHGGGCYALTPASGSVHRIDSSLKRTGGRKLARQLSEIRLSPAGQLLALSPETREIIAADEDTLQPLHRLKMGTRRSDGGAIAMDVSHSGDIAVSLGPERTVSLFAVDGRQRTTELAGEPGELRFRADGNLLIVTRPADRVLTMLSIPELRVVAELPLAMEPRNLCFKPDGGELFVTGPGMDGLAIVFPYKMLEVEQTILAGHNPGCMACAEQPIYLFVGSNNGSTISILNIPTRQMVALVGVGVQPRFIAITPDNQYALILDEGSGDMAVVRIPEIRRIPRGRNGAALFALITVGEKPVHTAIVPYRSKNQPLG